MPQQMLHSCPSHIIKVFGFAQCPVYPVLPSSHSKCPHCPAQKTGEDMEELSMANKDILEDFFHNPNVKSDMETSGTEKEGQEVLEAGMREWEL